MLVATPSVRARSITAIALVCVAIPACSSGPQLRSDSKPAAASDDKPKEPVVVRVADADRDGDGIPDTVDRCPDEPEDYDGFQDDDGCPDRDNDNDGVPDAEDRCLNTPVVRSSSSSPTYIASLTRSRIQSGTRALRWHGKV